MKYVDEKDIKQNIERKFIYYLETFVLNESNISETMTMLAVMLLKNTIKKKKKIAAKVPYGYCKLCAKINLHWSEKAQLKFL